MAGRTIMQPDPSYYQQLVQRYFDNTLTRQELDELLSMAHSGQYDEALTAALLQQWEAAKTEQRDPQIDWDSKLDNLLQEHRSPAVVLPVTRRRKWYRIAAAAAALLLTLGAGTYYLTRPGAPATAYNIEALTLSADTIILKPGTDGAVLTLANGEKITLDSAGKGLLAMQGNTKVLNNGGSLRYNTTNTTTETLYNTLQTPKGKQFQLQLSDGTKVWLNAASSIRFPTVFTNNTRQVEITGEAYFEVAHLERNNRHGKPSPQPFIVTFTDATGRPGQVDVLGTHFNVNAYHDEAAVKTTLLEGKVRVYMNQQTTLLSPGQQACLKQGQIKTNNDIDTDAVVAWKNGYFSFNETDMPTLMRQIARWYDVEIEYAGTIPNRRFGGEISRNSNAQQVLKIMEESAVRFKIAGKKIIVML